jgi:urease accessory protein
MSTDIVHRATGIRPAGTWRGAAADVVVLAHDDRHRRRVVLTCMSGRRVLLDLPEARVLRHGDGLVVAGGAIVRVEAAPERLLEVTAADAHALARLAWHLGNRHLPTQFLAGALRIRDDHVIADMLLRLGAHVVPVEAPFDPEGGAYGHGAVHGHGHGHDHRHEHAHVHDHGHGHDHRHTRREPPS